MLNKIIRLTLSGLFLLGSADINAYAQAFDLSAPVPAQAEAAASPQQSDIAPASQTQSGGNLNAAETIVVPPREETPVIEEEPLSEEAAAPIAQEEPAAAVSVPEAIAPKAEEAAAKVEGVSANSEEASLPAETVATTEEPSLPAEAAEEIKDDIQNAAQTNNPVEEEADFEDAAFIAGEAAASEAAAGPASSRASAATTDDDYFTNMRRRGGFRLFEPSRYEFMQEALPMMLPPAASEEEEDWDNYYRYSRRFLEDVIDNIDGGVELRERGIEYLEILNPSLMLPLYGTTISITGRKTLGITYSSKKYKTKKTIYDRDTSSFDFEQEMQLKLQGKVSDRIFVDVDYDDQREEAQNISIAYRGKPGEFVQSADFGDIELSLPNTEFLSYNKQVFGAKMHMQYGGANLRLIGSQTKGESKSKQFKGDSVFETVNIRDVQYIRRRYYDLTFGGTDPRWTRPIATGSEKVYVDDHTNQGYQIAMRADDLAVPASVYPQSGGNAAFKLLTRGTDYVIDYNRNLLILNNARADTDIVAIDFTNIDGDVLSAGTGLAKLIKTSGDRPLNDSINEIGYKSEIKRFYDIGAKQITRDNGQGNFTLKLLESDGREACSATGAPDYCRFIIDYDKGVFEITGTFPDLGIYATTPSSQANRYFFVQFSSSVRTYFLEPDIVVQSERVKINGATMVRNRDYYVDYASGYITFYKDELIGSNSVIDVSYETSSGGTGETALLGGRFNYDFTHNISVGTSFLNEGGSTPKRVPNVGSLTSNLTVMEADFKAKDVEVVDGVKLSVGVEGAQSKKDENLFGYAMIDNLEETKEYVRASMAFSDWFISSNPNGRTSFLRADVGGTEKDSVTWDTEEVKALDINPNNTGRADAKQTVLAINYDFSVAADKGYPANDEVSIVFPISPQGVDFTKKTLFELIMLGELNGPDINITFGTVDERSDNYNFIPAGFSERDIFPDCSKYYSPGQFYVPKTEDLRCTGQLTSAEDIGWLFVNPDGSYGRYDPFRNNKFNKVPQPNGAVDVQDLNGNGLYDSDDPTSGGNFGFNGTGIDGLTGGQTINFDNWRQFNQEFDFSDASRWSAVKHIRITLKKNTGGKNTGTIKIANLAVSGSTWQPLDESIATSGALTSYGINNIDNTDYKPIFNDNGDGGQVFRKLYGSVSDMRSEAHGNVKEQSLALGFDFSKAPTPDVYVQNNFSRMDFSQHRAFNFLIYNNNIMPDGDTSFYLQIATDDNNYSEIEIPLDHTKTWRLYTLKLIDTNGDNTPERWEDAGNYPLPPGAVKNMGYLNFKRISTIKAGVRGQGASAATATGEVWLNEIYLSESVVTEGSAYMAEAKIDVDNWFEAGGKYTYMDDNFQTPLSVPSKQKNTSEDYYLKIKRLQHLPVTATYHRSNTVTPDVLDYDKSNTVSLLDAGEVDRDRGTVRAEYNNPAAPRLGVEYLFENTDYQKLERSDARQYYNATLDYRAQAKEPLIRNLSAGASYNKNKINYSDAVSQSAPSSYYNADERTQSYNLKLGLEPWRGASITPNYSLALVDERRRYFDNTSFRERHYDKGASQTAGVTAALRLTSWLAPTASYNIITKENNNLTPVTSSLTGQTFEIGEVKSINRTSDANINLSLNGREILPKAKLFAGLTVSGAYKLQDGDSWENVSAAENSLDKIWIRSSLGLNAPYTYRSKLTLRDTYTSTMRWTPFQQYNFDGWRAPFKTLSLINNFTKTYQTTEDLGSRSESELTTLPDAIFFIDELEKLLGTGGFMKGTNIKLKYNATDTETIGTEFKQEKSYGGDLRFVLFNYFDNTFSYTEQTLGKKDVRFNAPLEDYTRRDFSAQTSFNYKRFRFTPKFTYLFDTRTQTGDTLVSEVEEFIPSLNIRADFNLPFGLKLPFITRQYLITNRIIWNSNLSYSRRRSFTITENRDLIDVNTSMDYEISKNIRLTLSGAFQNYKHIYIQEESYDAFTVGTLVTIQF